MGFYRDGRWRPSANEIAAGEYDDNPGNTEARLRQRIARLEEVFRHRHVATDSDACGQCGLDIRDPIHIRG